jgi:hypothetical protein
MNQSDCGVSPEGGSIALNLPDQNGNPCNLVLTFDEASVFAMTLPRLLKKVLRQNIQTHLVSYVYRGRGCAVECVFVASAADDGLRCFRNQD